MREPVDVRHGLHLDCNPGHILSMTVYSSSMRCYSHGNLSSLKDRWDFSVFLQMCHNNLKLKCLIKNIMRKEIA